MADKKIICKSNAKLKFLYRHTKTINMKTKKLLTAALIQCHFDYACSSWFSGLTKTYKSRLQCTQNKVIRFILNAPARTHIGLREFRLVNMLPVELRVKQLKLNLVYNVINDKAPKYMSNLINVACKQHGINTRSSVMSLCVPYVKSFGQTSFYYTGIHAWNELPFSIQSVQNMRQFKCLLKQFLFSCLNDQEASLFIYY